MQKTLRVALVVAALAAVGVAGSAGAAKLITGQGIQNGSIGLTDLSKSAKKALKGAAGPVGPQGTAGPAGATGPAGAPGPASLSTTVRTKELFAPANDLASGEVRCPAGMVAIGGSVAPGALYTVVDLPSSDGRGWIGVAAEANGESGDSMLLAVICTPGTPQVLPIGASHGGGSVETLVAHARAALDR